MSLKRRNKLHFPVAHKFYLDKISAFINGHSILSSSTFPCKFYLPICCTYNRVSSSCEAIFGHKNADGHLEYLCEATDWLEEAEGLDCRAR